MKLRRLRERLNLTQQELADELGTSCTNISHWESSTNLPQNKSIRMLQAYFGKDAISKEDFREDYTRKKMGYD